MTWPQSATTSGDHVLVDDLTSEDPGYPGNFEPIGAEDVEALETEGEEPESFTGTFDGNGNRIEDLKVDVEFGGLLAWIDEGGAVTNLRLESVEINTASGGAITTVNSGSITDCFCSGTVNADGFGPGIGGIDGLLTSQGSTEGWSCHCRCYCYGNKGFQGRRSWLRGSWWSGRYWWE